VELSTGRLDEVVSTAAKHLEQRGSRKMRRMMNGDEMAKPA